MTEDSIRFSRCWLTAKVPAAQIITEHPAIRVGLVFRGRQSPGVRNVIWGLHKALKIHNPNSTLLGLAFWDLLDGLDQIRTTEQVQAALTACNDLKLDGLVIIGGVTSNIDAAQLAEAKCSKKVVGVPVTLNGDLKNQFVEANVDLDTICKVSIQIFRNFYCSSKRNSGEKTPTDSVIIYLLMDLAHGQFPTYQYVCTDVLSAEKVILGEEVAASKLTLSDITKQICDVIQARAEQGLIESIPEVYALLKIETDKLLAHLVEDEINKRLARGSLPSKFDCDYSYVLGHVCYHILAAGLNGYMATITNLKNPAMMTVKCWSQNPNPLAIGKPAIHPATVDLKVKPGCSQEVLKAASSVMASVKEVLSVMSSSSSGAQTL
ncbi:Pyrophosphate--fructose 6-phosphate 1-phosphotransferase subunit alpha [Hibiscus syriacus]|uniref:Pyrophosphate--fructose 6-phosphate 1-phosphotransferase subunit alpha n=1 Tax=Hibiscus syriacus TaxID=106335 RepID=A0A6A3BJE2_HIBSY|nr:Pyrophosphate--fructose 6-phosphate 1-phosphotransferase subunit alpha [Hibiscus syriacus]